MDLKDINISKIRNGEIVETQKTVNEFLEELKTELKNIENEED